MVSIKISTISTTLTIAISSRFPTRTKTVVGTRTTVVGTTETSLLRTVVLATVMVETTVTRTPTTTLTFATTSYETGAPPLVTFKKLAQRATISPICSCFLTSTFANELVEDHNYRVSHCNTHKRRHGYLEKHIFFFLHSDFDGINHGNSSDNRRATLTTVIITPSPLPDTSCGNSGVNVWLYNSPFSSGAPNTDFETSSSARPYREVAAPALKSPSITIPFQGLPIISQISTLTGLNQIHPLIKTSLRISVLQPRRRQIPLDSQLTASYSRSILVVIFTRLRPAVILLTSSGHADDYALIWTGAKAVTGFKANNNDTYGHHPTPDGSYVADLTAGSYLPLNLVCCMGMEAVPRRCVAVVDG
ncbi:hypothetical protein TWF594_003517 [Orbilia oligospora]|nr:hypothetical protein TWF594_003517 [Orbilia oligospora]